MEHAHLRAFLEKAGSQLVAIRGGLLLAAQNGLSARHAETAANRVSWIENEAASMGLNTVSGFAERMRGLSQCDAPNANAALDIVAAAEAALLQYSLSSGDFLDDVDELVESSIGSLDECPPAGVACQKPPADADDDFDIDEESLEIFREEANGLLANITANLSLLASAPEDTNALWEIRRNAHTFKGAAGIIGFKTASSLAHRLEDVLDKMVELRCASNARVLELLANTTDRLQKMTYGAGEDDTAVVAAVIADLDAMLGGLVSMPAAGSRDTHGKPGIEATRQADNVKPAPVPMVRVSLDRLDELIRLSLLIAREDSDVQQLASDISQKLARLRMIRFGTLETRLGRAVHVTCQEENKKADLTFRGADVEIDTQIIDALIEPLLHLLKNAVVHGIEPAETRRLLGKNEKGRIEVSAAADPKRLTVTVSDDGSGISLERLIQQAVKKNILSAEDAETISDPEAMELIFHRGLTTAGSLGINAGRGVGMSIIKQSVESRGGTLGVSSEPHKGSTFTISLPVVEVAAEPAHENPLGAAGLPLVLVVDDSLSIRRQMAKFVEDAGLRAITAVNAAEALELLLNGLEPDLILSDVEMPNMNGWEFLEYVKTDKNFGHVPVVMVTSLDADKYRQMASRLGAADYLVKPFGAKDLERVLEKFCAEVV